jgi:nitrite reductase (NADH) small subunit
LEAQSGKADKCSASGAELIHIRTFDQLPAENDGGGVMTTWIDVCSADDLQPNSGVCALVAGKQVAIFYMPEDGAVFAIGNYDPVGNANVLSRGVIGDLQGQPVVASPLYKQHYNLLTGVCLEDPNLIVPAYAVHIDGGRVLVGMTE